MQVVKEAIVSVDGYDADRRVAVRKAAQGLNLKKEAAVTIFSKAVCLFPQKIHYIDWPIFFSKYYYIFSCIATANSINFLHYQIQTTGAEIVPELHPESKSSWKPN